MHELLTMKLGFNTFLLYVLGIPAIGIVAVTGGVARTMTWRPSWYWLGFSGWLVVAVPFSSYRGGSLSLVFTYFRTEIIMLFLIGGLVISWRECWQLLQVLALAALANVLTGHFFAASVEGRLELVDVMMSNSNDYAAQSILLLPFLLLVVLTPGRAIVLRLVALAFGAWGGYLVLATGSRGGLVALTIAALYTLWKLPVRHKLALVLIALVMSIVLVASLPSQTMARLFTFIDADRPRLSSADDSTQHAEEIAAGTTQSRLYLLKRSLSFTLQRPLFGVGPGQFSDFEGQTAREGGSRGAWHDTHNTYTQVSSEGGIPALVLFLAALVSTYRLLNKVYREGRQKPATLENRRIVLAAACVMLAMIAFCSAIFFLSLAYRFFLPALTGLAIALSRAAHYEWNVAPAES